MATFWELLRESVLVQGIVTLSLVTHFIITEQRGFECSEALLITLSLALGFYFGSKAAQAGKAELRSIIKGQQAEIAGAKNDKSTGA